MRVLFGSLILLFLVACGQSAPDKEKLELGNKAIFSHVVGRDTPKGKGAILLKEKIEKQGFKFYGELQVYPDSLLFSDSKVMDALGKNKVQLAAPSISKLVSENQKKLQIFDFPFLFKDIEEVETFYNRVKDKLFFQEEGVMYLDKAKKYVVLGLWQGGMKQLSSRNEISQTSDKPLKGQRVRIQSSEVLNLTFKALGAEPMVEDDFKKVRLKLKKGEIDGQENTWSNSYAEKYHEDEIQKYFVETNHGYLGYLLVANKDFWKELRSRSRDGKRFDEIWKTQIEEVTKEVKDLAQRSNETGKKKITEPKQAESQKIELFTLNNEQREKWCHSVYDQALAQEWEKIAKQIGKALIHDAITGKTGCPSDYLKGVLDQGKGIPD